jgi:hypothetical protein
MIGGSGAEDISNYFDGGTGVNYYFGGDRGFSTVNTFNVRLAASM